MGTLCSGQQAANHLPVLELPNQVPDTPYYQLFKARSARYGDLSVMTDDRNNYIFLLKCDKSDDIRVNLPVLNEVVHCAIHGNYKLRITRQIIVDVFCKSLPQTLIAVKNQRSGSEFSMKCIPFKGYNSYQFKRGLQEIWIHQKKLANKKDMSYFLNLCDSFIYGVNPDKQVLVLLFDRVETSLYNVAEYRKLANWPWTDVQKLKILYQLIESCAKLNEYEVVHRDIRPNNLLYNTRLNRFVLGNFSSARSRHSIDESHDQDLMTVCGVEFLSEEKMKGLVKEKQEVGLYNWKKVVYNGIRNVINILQSRNIFDKNPPIHHPVLQQVSQLVSTLAPFQNILTYISSQSAILPFTGIFLLEDDEISRLCSGLLSKKYTEFAQKCQFQVYDCLGYHKEFSEMAHRVIERNHQNGKPLQNAYILKHLGEFYQKNGSKGTQYFINSCILFCKRAQLNLRYRKFPESAANLQKAEETYLRASANNELPLNLIEIRRLRAELKAQGGHTDEAKQMIHKIVLYAAERSLSVQKQLNLFISSALIFSAAGDKDTALQRLKNGLAICENSGAFQSPTSCMLYKSKFLYRLGVFYLDDLKEKHNPQKKPSQQSYSPALKGNVETHFKASLEIRQRESTDHFEIAQCLEGLGSFYFIIEEHSEARSCYRRALIQMSDIRSELNPEIIADVYYDLGSISYKLKEYADAESRYHEAIDILRKDGGDSYWISCIEGNLSLAMLQQNKGQQAEDIFNKVKDIIRKEKGQNHYDYVFLMREKMLIAKNH